MTTENGASFTSKEMLVRIDAKVDVIAAKQANYDVELALLKARQEEQARTAREKDQDFESKYDQLAGQYEELRRTQEKFGRKLAYATGTLSVVVIAANWLVPSIARNLLG